MLKLTKDKYAIVDDSDFDWLNQWRWYYTHGYAARDTADGRIYMHRLLANPKAPLVTDHINRNKLDNRRSNLRVTSRSINQFNRPKQPNNTSGVIGVVFEKNRQKWRAQIKKNSKLIHLGYFTDKNEAIKARKEAELNYESI